MISVKNLKKNFKNNEVLKNINFDINKGEVVVIDENFSIRVTEIMKGKGVL